MGGRYDDRAGIYGVGGRKAIRRGVVRKSLQRPRRAHVQGWQAIRGPVPPVAAYHTYLCNLSFAGVGTASKCVPSHSPSVLFCVLCTSLSPNPGPNALTSCLCICIHRASTSSTKCMDEEVRHISAPFAPFCGHSYCLLNSCDDSRHICWNSAKLNVFDFEQCTFGPRERGMRANTRRTKRMDGVCRPGQVVHGILF